MSDQYEKAADALTAAFEPEKTVHIQLSVQDLTALKHVLDSVFSAVRAGKLHEVKEVTGIDNMIDAAHLVSVRKALGY